MPVIRRFAASLLCFAVLSLSATMVASASTDQFKLPDGRTASVGDSGIVRIVSKDHRTVEAQVLRLGPAYGNGIRRSTPDRLHAMAQIMSRRASRFAPNRVIVVYRDGVSAPQDVLSVDVSTLRSLRTAFSKRNSAYPAVPVYTSDLTVNRALASIGVDRSERLFRHFSRSMLAAMRTASSATIPALDLANAYRLHISSASVPRAVALLAKLPSVAYVSPDWTLSPTRISSVPIDSKQIAAADEQSFVADSEPEAANASGIPSNYALRTSAQSLLNAPGVDAAAAFAEIKARFNQIPGQGELITDVALGDLTDSSAASNFNDPCFIDALVYGPTTIVQNGQRYLDLPSMPLIPTYISDGSGGLSGSAEVCGVDPLISEIGLDFSMMAALPHDLQRSAERGKGLTDLLGIAPGADYRLVTPGGDTNSDLVAALLAAAVQTPHPDVITVSLSAGFDEYGFPSRYIEEDPLTESVVAAVVRQYGVVICIAANDGTGTETTVAIGPSGGSAATDTVTSSAKLTSLSDDSFSTIPGEVFDSGAIDVGGTTLDDIFADPPQYANTQAAIAQHAYAETRWDGFTTFSSGFGSRVDVAAPADNVLGLEHALGGAADAVQVALTGGTSASAAQTAAAAAVAMQVARLTGRPFKNAQAVRAFLRKTGMSVGDVTQADRPLHVGSQIDLRAAVEKLFEQANIRPAPSVARVAVEQRRSYANLDSAFLSNTNPKNIDLQTGTNQLAWITIAPDWTFVPKNASYRLFVKHRAGKPIATTPWARVLPATIFQAAGLSLNSSSRQHVNLVYEARSGAKVLASASIDLGFGPASATIAGALAPKVPAVVTGATIPVTYDVSAVSGLASPRLLVSEPGRLNPATGVIFHPAYTAPLPASKTGTIDVPVSALQGGGVYGIGIELDSVNGVFSDFAVTRVAATAQRPPAPLLSSNGSVPGHLLEIPYGSSFQVSYDVSTIPNATGARLEVSAPGPGARSIYNPFNNPNGTVEDHNGVDTGSVYSVRLSGTSGKVTVPASVLDRTMNHVVRVIPMRGGKAAGEASDVSSITMDGVTTLDGGLPNNGFGINQNGSDGFLTSEQTTASGQLISTLQTFSQTNNLASDIFATTESSLFTTVGAGVFGNDVGLVATQAVPADTLTYAVLDPVASGVLGAGWTPPSTIAVAGAAPDQTGTTAAFWGEDTTSAHAEVFTSDLTSNTFGTLYDISGAYPTIQFPSFGGIGENTSNGTAVVPVGNLLGGSSGAPVPPTMVTVNLTTGTVGSFPGRGLGNPLSVGVDSGTGIAAVTTDADEGLSIYNLATQSGNEVILPGGEYGLGTGYYSAIDQNAHRILIAQIQTADALTNNNSVSCVLVYNESGRLVKKLERFDLYETTLFVPNQDLQVNPNTRTGYLIGPQETQLVPFAY